MKNFQIYSKPDKIYKEMLIDILSAKKYIFLETYIFDNDEIGKKFREALEKKARQGVKIRLLLDDWGGTAKKDFFKELIKLGGEVRFFKEIQYFVRFFTKNHERNHRKLLLIDDKITYMGSANITAKCLNYRELVLRLNGDITGSFVKSFLESWEMFGRLTKKKIKIIAHREFQILHDIPSIYSRITEKKYIELFRKSKKDIKIETPYFVPSNKIIALMEKAVKRKVNVNLIIPTDSNSRIVDIFRNRYLGYLHKKGIKIHYYQGTLHSKLMIVDDKFFILGSSNLDFRSFIYQYEINFFGNDEKLIKALEDYFNETMKNTKPFDYNRWKNRSSFKKSLELLFNFIKKYL